MLSLANCRPGTAKARANLNLATFFDSNELWTVKFGLFTLESIFRSNQTEKTSNRPIFGIFEGTYGFVFSKVLFQYQRL